MRFFIFIFIFILFYKIDLFLAKNRAEFVVSKISFFLDDNHRLTHDLSKVSYLFNNEDLNSESYCNFWDKRIDGIGFCYYSYIKDNDYYLLINSVFHSIIYSSEDKIYKQEDGLH